MTKKLDRGPHRAIKWVLKISTLTILIGIGLLSSNWALAGVDYFTYPGTMTKGGITWTDFWISRTIFNEKYVGIFYDSDCYGTDPITNITHQFKLTCATTGLVWKGVDCDINMENCGYSVSDNPSNVWINSIFRDDGGGNYVLEPALCDLWSSSHDIYSSGGDQHIIVYGFNLPPGLEFSVVSPASESTIEDIEDEITFSWSGWNFEDIWTEFLFWFIEENTGLATHRVLYEPLTENGQISFPFSDFEFEKNGDYYLKARKSSVKYGQELIYPDYWIRIEIEGWEYLFEMPDWETWYSENVEQFATPTAVFSGFAGFISPIFNKIGEFGNTALKFLDTDEAYDTGYNLGINIPVFSHYVDEIEVFFGGFPIIKVFLGFMVILIGIFIVRLILKFIPGLG